MTRLNLTHSQTKTLRQQVSRETGLKRSTSSRKLIPATMKCTVHPKKYLEKYPEFKTLYLTRLDYTKKGIKKELELTEHEYNCLRKKCNAETGLKRNCYFIVTDETIALFNDIYDATKVCDSYQSQDVCIQRIPGELE